MGMKGGAVSVPQTEYSMLMGYTPLSSAHHYILAHCPVASVPAAASRGYPGSSLYFIHLWLYLSCFWTPEPHPLMQLSEVPGEPASNTSASVNALLFDS